MRQLKIVKRELGVVMSHTPPDRIPAGVESARKLNMRWQHYGWPGITRTLDGDILVSASERIRHVDPFGREAISRSTDGGHTWEDRVYPTIVGQHAGPSVLSDGRLIYCGPISGEADARLAATMSDDGGKTWRIIGEIPCHAAVHPTTGRVWPSLNESHALETEPDHILCVFRAGGDPYNVYFTRSEDGGRTWTEPEDSGVYGHPSYLIRLEAGPILCVFGDRAGGDGTRPQAIRAMLSYDDGRTWDTANILAVREFPYRADMGYPVALEVSANEVLCAYYSMPDPGHTGQAYEALSDVDGGILSTRIWLGET